MSEGNDSGSEKSLDPTPERLKRARQEGNVPSSPELQTLGRFIGLLIGTIGIAGAVAMPFASSLMPFWDRPADAAGWLLQGGSVLEAFGPTAMFFLGIIFLAPVLAMVAVVAQQAVAFSGKKIKPKLSKLNPITNAKNKFGPAGLVEFTKGAVKMVVVTISAVLVGITMFPEMMASVGAPAAPAFDEMRKIAVIMLSVAVVLAAAAAALEVPFKWAQHRSKLKMSYQEVKDESKENEGDADQKNKRRQMGRQLAQNRQMADVPTADVVVVNPSHYAVALKWDRTSGDVPRCVAKGVDHIALQIRMRAESAQVPVYRDVPTARSLYATVEVGEEIRREHYEAVAAAIRFADKLTRKSPPKPN
ncbi:MAG: flagellar type III secretion system protein FlhB [Pseudomonadota bacterium]